LRCGRPCRRTGCAARRLPRPSASACRSCSAPSLLSQRGTCWRAGRASSWRRAPAVEGHFRSLDRLADLAPDTRVRRREGLSCTVVVENGTATIHFGGTWVAGPARIAPLQRFVAATEAFRIADLPGRLDDNGKVVLVRRLVRDGLLRVDPPGANTPNRSGENPDRLD